MKMYLISENIDTYTGMRLAGVDGIIVNDSASFKEAFEGALEDKELGILLISDSLFAANSDMIIDKKLNLRTPLILSIPDRGKNAAVTDAISSYIGDAIGVKL